MIAMVGSPEFPMPSRPPPGAPPTLWAVLRAHPAPGYCPLRGSSPQNQQGGSPPPEFPMPTRPPPGAPPATATALPEYFQIASSDYSTDTESSSNTTKLHYSGPVLHDPWNEQLQEIQLVDTPPRPSFRTYSWYYTMPHWPSLLVPRLEAETWLNLLA